MGCTCDTEVCTLAFTGESRRFLVCGSLQIYGLYRLEGEVMYLALLYTRLVPS